MADPVLGPLLSVFSDTKEKPLYLSDPWKQALDESAGVLKQQRVQNQQSLADFQAGLDRARAQIEPLAQADIGTLGSQIARYNSYDPFSAFQQTGNQYMDWGNQIAKNVADYGSNRVKLADAGLYGGRGGGSYGTNLLLNNVTRNLAPVWANILGQTNQAYLAQQQDRAANLQQLNQLMAQRRGIPLENANLALAPIQARQNVLMGELGAGGAAADALRKLYRGSEVKQNWAGKLLGQVNSAFDSGLNAATSLAGDAVAAYTGGMAGRGGTKTPAVSPSTSAFADSSFYPAPEGTNYGGYAPSQSYPQQVAEGSSWYSQPIYPPGYNTVFNTAPMITVAPQEPNLWEGTTNYTGRY